MAICLIQHQTLGTDEAKETRGQNAQLIIQCKDQFLQNVGKNVSSTKIGLLSRQEDGPLRYFDLTRNTRRGWDRSRDVAKKRTR